MHILCINIYYVYISVKSTFSGPQNQHFKYILRPITSQKTYRVYVHIWKWVFPAATVQQRQHADAVGRGSFSVGRTERFSLIFCKLLVGAPRFVVDVLQPLATPWLRAWWPYIDRDSWELLTIADCCPWRPTLLLAMTLCQAHGCVSYRYQCWRHCIHSIFVKHTVSWNVTLCNLVDIYRRTERTSPLILKVDGVPQDPLKRQQLSTNSTAPHLSRPSLQT